MAESRQMCTFQLANLFFGIDVQWVQEVLKYRELTQVPLAPTEVRGLINLRGQIATAIDLRRRLSLPDRTDGRMPMNIVVRNAEGIISFLVDEIRDVVAVSEDQFEPAPETLNGMIRDLLHGVYKLDHGLLLILDVDRLLDI
ncbi:MAG: chemotaxis protein CheW [Pseudomonadota bacterium]